MRQDISRESLFILFIFCNPNDNFVIGVDGGVLMLADFGKAFVIGSPDLHSGNVVWWKKDDLHRDDGNT